MAKLLRLPGLPNPTDPPAGNHLLSRRDHRLAAPIPFPSSPSLRPSSSLSLSLNLSTQIRSSAPDLPPLATDLGGGGGGGGDHGNGTGGSGGGGWSSRDEGSGDDRPSDSPSDLGPLGLFIAGWRSRVAADPQFPFKVLMEELVGVSACVLGDMASRPNFGLNELDFVFSTLVVGSILNFVLMYLLAPTAGAASAATALPGLFAGCPPGHMFQPGAYSLLDRMGTFVYKGTLFACVGFAAGLAGTALSKGLIALRKMMDPAFETPNKAPPTVLNALTWAIHMGVSSNLRYQTLNGVEFLMERVLPPPAFKGSVLVLRCLNNVVGGVSFVALARLTGSQKVEGKVVAEEDEMREKLICYSDNGDLEPQRTGSESLTSNVSHCGASCSESRLCSGV